jgi:hypothetical protein
MTAPPPSNARTFGILAIVAISTPLALAVETLLRHLVFPPEFEDVRVWLRPSITPWVWAAPILAAAMTVVGIGLQRWLAQRAIGRLAPTDRTEAKLAAARFDGLMLSTSAPQVPALLGTVAFMLGSELAPVLAGIAVATTGVLVVGWATRSSA